MRSSAEPSVHRVRGGAMTDTITIGRYEGPRIQRNSPDLAYLERIAPDTMDPVSPGRDTVAALPGGRAVTAAVSLGVTETLLAAASREQPDGRIFAVLPAGHPANRVARGAGWHEVLRSRSGTQLLLHPGHPSLASILLRA